MDYKTWNVVAKFKDGSESKFELLGPHADAKSVEEHVKKHMPELTFGSATPMQADKVVPPAPAKV